jgi:hypothetical protein
MKRPLAGLRLGVILLFLLGFLSPLATSGAGAQAFSCDDLTATQAQALLDADPDLAEDLDPDGDGEACNHEEGTTDEATEEAGEETAAGDDEYLTAVQDELDYLGESFDRFIELNEQAADATEEELQDIADEVNSIAAEWVEYPDVAAELVAPAEFEDVETDYLDLADMVGETGELWEEYWSIPADDPEEDAAFEAFNDAFIDVQDQLDAVQAVVDDAGGAGGNTDPDPTEEATEDPTEEATEEASGGDADAYLSDVQDELDTLNDEATQLSEILDLQEAGDATQEDAELFTDIMATWSTYPDDVAAELVAPAGLEDVEDAYLDLADTMAETSIHWDDYLSADVGSPEEEDAFAALVDGVDSVQTQIEDVQALIDDAGGSGGNTDPDPTEEATEDPTEEATEEATGGDADAYLADVTDTADEWNESISRFNELLGGDLTDADIDELSGILVAWVGAPDVAASMDAPEGMEDVQAAFEDYADSISEMGLNFTTYLGTEANSPESEEALTAFGDSMTQALADYNALQDEITAVS